jgi:hypothetical protein
MAKMVKWTPEQASKELAKRLKFSKEQRMRLEQEWDLNESTVMNAAGEASRIGMGVDWNTGAISDNANQSDSDVGVNYAFKNFRFIHSQLCANPPTVIPRPTSSDLSDRRKADAADRLVRYAMRTYGLPEVFAQATYHCLLFGTGFIRTAWDVDSGEPLDFDPETEELTMEGDIQFKSIHPRQIYLDPDATRWSEVKYVMELMHMPYDEALYRFPEKAEQLKKFRREQSGYGEQEPTTYDSAFKVSPYDVVEIYEYWEKGLPYNGMIGRHCYFLADGTLLTDMQPNPFRFTSPRDRGLGLPEQALADSSKDLPATAYLPYHPLTDIDIGNSVLGRSFITYEAPLQATYNRVLSSLLDCVQAHGVTRVLLPEGAEISDKAITNSPWDIVRFTGNQPPSFMEPMPYPPAAADLLQLVKQGGDDMAAVNESMFGQQSREQSGFSMQYATNQGNMIRRRLFDKYVTLVENVYKSYLNLVRKHWSEPRTILVLGKEKAFESIDIQGADIDGGFDLVVEYGASLSLDPTSRRQELLQLFPIFQQAETDPAAKKLLSMLRLNELEGMYDRTQLASDRQREIFEEMIASDIYIGPAEAEDDVNMLAWASDYRMSAEFKYLTPEHQTLILRHIKDRALKVAQSAGMAGGQPAPAAGGGGGGAAAGQLPVVPGGAPMDVAASPASMLQK